MKEETKKRGRFGLTLLAVAALAAGLFGGWFARDFMAVDACLDAGGAWAAGGVCLGVTHQ